MRQELKEKIHDSILLNMFIDKIIETIGPIIDAEIEQQRLVKD